MAAEKYFPFRSVSGDRKYSAEDWAAFFALLISNGVFYSSADRLKIVANDGMKIKVNKGAAFIAGRMYMLETDRYITLDTADGVLNRIDRIVVRCDYTNRIITTEVIKGDYSEKPTAPELTRNADTYELALADIYVAAGVITITNANITDQRLNTSLCGIVTGLIDQADTTEIFNQFQEFMSEFTEESRKEFDIWFEEVKGVLSDDVAGNLLARIEALEETMPEVSNSNIVTEAGKALDARQANPNLEGTMAYQIASQNETLAQLNSSLTYSTTNVIGETYATSSLKVYKRGNVCELVGTLTINKTFSVQSGIVTIDDACAPVVGGNWIPVKAMTTNGAEYPFFLIGTALYSIAGVSYPSGATIVFGDSCWLSK